MIRLVTTIALAASASACVSTKVSMFPVEGPVSKQSPLPTIVAKAENITSNSGPMTATMANGESCTGRWSSVAPQQVSYASGSLFSMYGGVAGFNAMSVSNVAGVNRGEAFMSCSGGTTVQAEFYTGSGTANGYGVAKDSLGNVYKMLF